MEVRSSFPIVYVDDVPTAVRFYRDLLGFEEMYRFPDIDAPGYVALRLDDGKIGLSSAARRWWFSPSRPTRCGVSGSPTSRTRTGTRCTSGVRSVSPGRRSG